jgi:hypothetical protein
MVLRELRALRPQPAPLPPKDQAHPAQPLRGVMLEDSSATKALQIQGLFAWPLLERTSLAFAKWRIY